METKGLGTTTQSILDPQVKMVKKLPKTSFKEIFLSAMGIVLVVLLGVASGWFLSSRAKGVGVSTPSGPGVKSTTTEVGIADEATFKDSAEGTLEEGGLNGEGTHHLVQEEGNPSRNVYLTSTVIDLSPFVGKKVKIWGQTVAGKKAGWLMDVGKLKVIE